MTIRDAHAWRPLLTLPGVLSPGHGALEYVMCNAIVFSADGRQMIVGQAGTPSDTGVVAYEIGSWQPAWQVKTSPFHPTSLAYSPDGKHLAVGGQASKVGLPGIVKASGFETE